MQMSTTLTSSIMVPLLLTSCIRRDAKLSAILVLVRGRIGGLIKINFHLNYWELITKAGPGNGGSIFAAWICSHQSCAPDWMYAKPKVSTLLNPITWKFTAMAQVFLLLMKTS